MAAFGVETWPATCLAHRQRVQTSPTTRETTGQELRTMVHNPAFVWYASSMSGRVRQSVMAVSPQRKDLQRIDRADFTPPGQQLDELPPRLRADAEMEAARGSLSTTT